LQENYPANDIISLVGIGEFRKLVLAGLRDQSEPVLAIAEGLVLTLLVTTEMPWKVLHDLHVLENPSAFIQLLRKNIDEICEGCWEALCVRDN